MTSFFGRTPLTPDHLAELALEIRAYAMREREPAVIDAMVRLAERLEGAEWMKSATSSSGRRSFDITVPSEQHS